MSLKTTEILKNSIPVAFAYITLGLTFGALFNSKGGAPLEALVIAVFCFAGAAQFVALEFYRPDTSFAFLFVTIFTINFRHIFYGSSFLSKWHSPQKYYLLSALTDENFGIASLYKEKRLSGQDWIKVFSLNHSYWVLGCVLGSLVPSSVLQRFLGAEFSLTALFLAIFATAIKKRKTQSALN